MYFYISKERKNLLPTGRLIGFFNFLTQIFTIMSAVQKPQVITPAQKSALPTVSPVTTTEVVKPTEQKPTQEITQTVTAQFTPPPPIAQPQITIHDVMKLLEVGNQKRELHEEFSKRVLNLENFKQRHENGSLKMIIIPADGDEDEITVSNHEIIIEALEKTVVKGREYLKRIEMELLSIF